MKEATFLRAFEDHHQALFRFAYRLTASAADAEEIVQECFLELLRPGCSFNSNRTPVRTYLFGAVRNQFLKRLRASGRNESMAPKEDPTPERQVLNSETARFVAGAIADLPESQREVLLLAHYEQMPLAEIAAALEIEIGTVKSRLQRARANLKQSLAVYASPEVKS